MENESIYDHAKYPISDWLYAVANRDTWLGYRDWVEHMRESDEQESSPDTIRIILSGGIVQGVVGLADTGVTVRVWNYDIDGHEGFDTLPTDDAGDAYVETIYD